MHSKILPIIIAACAVGACTSHQSPLFEGMGTHSRPADTDNPLAQRYFDQGLALSYGFNHDEAVRSFAEASRLDPDSAMAWWGQAYALGPNINLPLPDANAPRAYAAIQNAVARKGNARPVDQALIDALALRFADPTPKDRSALDRAYATAMAAVWQAYPEDDDVGVLYADALLNLHPWDQWTPDFKPKEHTLEIVATLERVFELNVNHPGANHLYIHTMEASANPARAEAAADRLGGLIPGVGHIVHMPAHIYIQVGRFRDSMECNEKASDLDRKYFKRVGPQGIYHAYHAHNNHFRVWSAMYQGRYKDALESCRRTILDLPEPMQADPSTAEWLIMETHVHIRFGEWEAALRTPRPRADQPYAVAMWRYGRGMAFANTGRTDQARAEMAAFEHEAARVPQTQTVWVIPAHDVLNVAREMLAGETAYHSGQPQAAFRHLRAAVKAEDGLRYSEPSPWMMPTRHALAALLLDQGRIAEAEPLYRQDLKKHPGNGWSLHGLAECLRRRGATAEAAEVEGEFERAWRFATVEIKASCFCRHVE